MCLIFCSQARSFYVRMQCIISGDEQIYDQIPVSMCCVEKEWTKYQGSKWFYNVYLAQGYLELPLEASLQEVMPIIKLDIIITPTIVVRETINSISHMKGKIIKNVPNEYHTSILTCDNDAFIHVKTFAQRFAKILRVDQTRSWNSSSDHQKSVQRKHIPGWNLSRNGGRTSNISRSAIARGLSKIRQSSYSLVYTILLVC